MSYKIVWGLVLWLVTPFCLAESLVTIHDSGNTLSVAPYLRRDEMPRPVPPKNFSQVSPLARQFPLSTPALSPGKVEQRAIELPHVQTPLFVVGSDRYSKEWLAYRRDELIAIGAVGMLVEGKSFDDFNEMQRIGQGLNLFPVSGEALVKTIELKHYPVLITKFSIEQ